jgi:hypothetical protein
MMPLWGGGIIGRSYDTQTAEQPDDFGEIIGIQSSPMDPVNESISIT